MTKVTAAQKRIIGKTINEANAAADRLEAQGVSPEVARLIRPMSTLVKEKAAKEQADKKKRRSVMYYPDKTIKHEERDLLDPTGVICGIDEGIADLINLMWEKGFVTQFCCEGFDWNHPKKGDEHSWSAKQYRGYILMPRTDRTMDLVVTLLQKFERFNAGKRVNWDIEFEQTEFFNQLNRITLRFPKSDIPLLAEFIETHY